MSKTKFNIPNRKYADGDKKMVSMRLPEKLMKALKQLSEEKSWEVTDLVVTALDQYLQHEDKLKSKD